MVAQNAAAVTLCVIVVLCALPVTGALCNAKSG